MTQARQVALSVAGAAILLACLPTASAHAEPWQSEPAAGARLAEWPEEVWVRFTEPVYDDGTFIRILDADGDRVDNDDLRIDHGSKPVLRVTVPPDLPDGAYRIQWQTYSVTDGHTIQGSIGFAIGGFAPPETTTDAEGDLDLGGAIGRAAVYAGFAVAIGSFVYPRVVGGVAGWTLPKRLRPAGAGLAAIGMLILYLDTATGTGLGLTDYAASKGGQETLGRLALFLVLALLAPIYQSRQSGRIGTVVEAGGWLAAATWTASFGHVSIHGLLGVLLETAHLLAMAAWAGGLLLLLLHLRRLSDPGEIQATGTRFSRLALAAVVTLAASGLALSGLLVGRSLLQEPAAVLADSWSWFLAAKIILFLVALALAAANQWSLTGNLLPWRRIRPGHPTPGRRLRRTVAAEAVAISGALLAAGMLLSVSPPQALELDTEGLLERTTVGRDHTALLRIAPAPEAGETAELRFFIQTDPGQQPVHNNSCGRDDCLNVEYQLQGDDSTRQEVTLEPEGDGWWHAEALFVAPGEYTMTLSIQSVQVYLDELMFTDIAVERS